MAFELTEKQREFVKLLHTNVRYILLCGGSRSGKTAVIIYIQILLALANKGSRHLISRLHLSELKASVIHDTFPKVADLIDPSVGDYVFKHINRSDFFIKFPNKSEIWFTGLSDERRSDKVLGQEYLTIFMNEVSQIQYSVVQKAITRAAQKIGHMKNRLFFDCNPTTKMHWAYKLFMEHKDPIDDSPKNIKNYASIVMNPLDNPHLPDDYDDILSELSLSQQRRFRYGEWQAELEGAMWTLDLIEQNRARALPIDGYQRIVIAVDPAVSNNKTSDETGIIVAGRIGELSHVIADLSGRYSPLRWANVVKDAYNKYQADRVICEVNQGGDLVETNLRSAQVNLPILKIRAYKGKSLRAEPVVALYEQGKVKHTGRLNQLEDQLVSWIPSDPVFSPDRLDALVYAITELMLGKGRPTIATL